jgi:hypothetical protein
MYAHGVQFRIEAAQGWDTMRELQPQMVCLTRMYLHIVEW